MIFLAPEFGAAAVFTIGCGYCARQEGGLQ
jgi:hypothetical protein